MIKRESKDIEGVNVEVVQWPALKAFKNKFYLARVFNPVLAKIGGALAGANGKDMLTGDVDISMLAEAIGLLGESMDDREFETFIKKIFESTFFDHREFEFKNFDTIFTNNMMCFYKAVFYVLEVNFGDLFLAAKSISSTPKAGPTKSQERQEKNSH